MDSKKEGEDAGAAEGGRGAGKVGGKRRERNFKYV